MSALGRYRRAKARADKLQADAQAGLVSVDAAISARKAETRAWRAMDRARSKSRAGAAARDLYHRGADRIPTLGAPYGGPIADRLRSPWAMLAPVAMLASAITAKPKHRSTLALGALVSVLAIRRARRNP